MALRANFVLPSTPSTPKNGPEPLMMGNDVKCEKVNYLSISVRKIEDGWLSCIDEGREWVVIKGRQGSRVARRCN